MTDYIKRTDAIHAALHYEGAAAVAAIQGLKAFNPHDIMREMLIDAQIDSEIIRALRCEQLGDDECDETACRYYSELGCMSGIATRQAAGILERLEDDK